MTPKERAAMQQALEALEDLQQYYGSYELGKEAITALREALKQPDWEAIGKEQLRRYEEKFGALPQPVSQDFETWWEREGQEFLYALNTTTDDDIKLVAEVAWKNGAYKAEQPVSQEPVAWRVRGYSQFKTGNPAPWRYVDGTNKPMVNKPDCCDFEPLYTAPQPVKEVELTDEEIAKACGWGFGQPMYEWVVGLARAAIAAHKEKQK